VAGETGEVDHATPLARPSPSKQLFDVLAGCSDTSPRVLAIFAIEGILGWTSDRLR
jgi:hypothetical protein